MEQYITILDQENPNLKDITTLKIVKHKNLTNRLSSACATYMPKSCKYQMHVQDNHQIIGSSIYNLSLSIGYHPTTSLVPEWIYQKLVKTEKAIFWVQQEKQKMSYRPVLNIASSK